MLRNARFAIRVFFHFASGIALFSSFYSVSNQPAAAAELKTLHAFDFAHSANGSTPIGGVIFDNAGNLYGTAAGGGTHGGGIVFELSPTGAGGWTERVLYNFNSGDYPNGALVFDSAGNLYGTTYYGGGNPACGAVFELLPGSGVRWTHKVLYAFPCAPDGQWPNAGVILDAAGNIFGTTIYGGALNDGTVFELKRAPHGSWAERVVYSFGVQAFDGVNPQGRLAFDTFGNLYGTTDLGGGSFGTVFQVTQSGAEKALYYFNDGLDGAYPIAGVTFDSAGNLYGTTHAGGSGENGVVFEMTPTTAGWNEIPLYTFSSQNPNEGALLNSPVILDSRGNVYGETLGGEGSTLYGSVFELTPSAGGTWSEIQLASFYSEVVGFNPSGGLTFDNAGNLYGVASQGGPGGKGIVFEVIP